MGSDKPATATLTVMRFKLEGTATTAVPLPATLRPIEALGAAVAQKELVFGENMGMANGAMTMDFLIDGKSFDMNRVDLQMRVGEVETWEIYNGTDMDHPFHIHGTQFQIVEREINGKITPAEFLSWKDTVNLTRKETVCFKVRQSMPGKRMYHCHILEHEGAGMMGILNVT
jgi:bilirubin oxidase